MDLPSARTRLFFIRVHDGGLADVVDYTCPNTSLCPVNCFVRRQHHGCVATYLASLKVSGSQCTASIALLLLCEEQSKVL